MCRERNTDVNKNLNERFKSSSTLPINIRNDVKYSARYSI